MGFTAPVPGLLKPEFPIPELPLLVPALPTPLLLVLPVLPILENRPLDPDEGAGDGVRAAGVKVGGSVCVGVGNWVGKRSGAIGSIAGASVGGRAAGSVDRG